RQKHRVQRERRGRGSRLRQRPARGGGRAGHQCRRGRDPWRAPSGRRPHVASHDQVRLGGPRCGSALTADLSRVGGLVSLCMLSLIISALASPLEASGSARTATLSPFGGEGVANPLPSGERGGGGAMV